MAPKIYKVLLENERIRVLEVRLKPSKKSPTDGKTKEVKMKAGEAAWSDAESHAVDNIGCTRVRVLNIELKEPSKKGK